MTRYELYMRLKRSGYPMDSFNDVEDESKESALDVLSGEIEAGIIDEATAIYQGRDVVFDRIMDEHALSGRWLYA